MKANPLQYAKLLYELTKGKNKGDIDTLMPQMAAMLEKNGQLGKIKEITAKFKEVYDRNEGITEVEIISKEELPASTALMINTFLKMQKTDGKLEIKKTIDPNLKGGVIIKIGDEIIDLSVDRQLADLKKDITQ